MPCEQYVLNSAFKPLASDVEAAVTTHSIRRPSLSTNRCRLRPLIFFPASYPIVLPWVAVLTLCASMTPADGARPATLLRSILHRQRVQHPFPMALLSPTVKVAIYRLPMPKRWRQHRPRAAGFGPVEDAINHQTLITRRTAGATPTPKASRKQARKLLPLSIRNIRCIFEKGRTH